MSLPAINIAPGKLLPQRAVAEELGCCVRTLVRRIAADPSFPRPIVIGTRHYFSSAQIEDYKRKMISMAFSYPIVTPRNFAR